MRFYVYLKRKHPDDPTIEDTAIEIIEAVNAFEALEKAESRDSPEWSVRTVRNYLPTKEVSTSAKALKAKI